MLPSRWEGIIARGGKRGVLFTAAAAVACLLWFLLMPEAPLEVHHPMSPCKSNLKTIALALHNYNDRWKSFPPPFIADKDGKPMHSWRVLILPYMDERPLYESYDFSKPWDAAENRRVLERRPYVYTCPSDNFAAPNATSYVGVFGAGCMFDPAAPVRLRDVKDGTTNTLMVGEAVDVNIPWTKPEDIDVSLYPGINKPGGFGSRHEGGCNFAWVDGSVKYIYDDTDPETLNRLFHRNDGKSLDDFWSRER